MKRLTCISPPQISNARVISKQYFFILLACFQLTTCLQSLAQDSFNEKTQASKIGECTMLQSKVFTDKKNIYKVIDFQVDSDGEYFVDILVSLPQTQKGKPVKLYLDDKKISDDILPSSDDLWAISTIKNTKSNKQSSVFMSKGLHQLKFTLGSLEIPHVDQISIYRANFSGKLTETKANEYMKTLKANVMPADYADWKKKNKSARIAPNPEGNYDHQLQTPFNYTHFEYMYFNAGQQVSFQTANNSNSDPVMYLFDMFNAGNSSSSWSSDDYPNLGLNSRIEVTIPYSGYYALYIRAYWNINGDTRSNGTCDLYKDNTLYRSSIPVAGTSFQMFNTKLGQEVSYFTTKPSPYADTRLFISEGQTSILKGYNDDFVHSSPDFNWGFSSRIDLNSSSSNYFVQVCAYSIYSEGSCDVYANNLKSNVVQYFPNLKQVDAIQSAPANWDYNCISWAGGLTSSWTWPSAFSSWSGSNYLAFFDNFFGNNPARYAGAQTYTRSGADASNAVVALWANPNYESSEWGNPTNYTHASVREYGNEHPHGYDWESKPGSTMRTFHPRNALYDESNSNGYGYITDYYRYAGYNARMVSNRHMTLEQSISEGLSKLDTTEMNQKEKESLGKWKNKVESKKVKEFEKLLRDLEDYATNEQIAYLSNPRKMFGNAKAYTALRDWCTKEGKDSHPLLIESYSPSKIHSLLLAEDILLKSYPALLDSVKNENKRQLNDEKGAYIVRSSEINCVRFLRKIINQEEKVNEDKKNNLNQNYPNEVISQTTISFDLIENSQVSLKIFDTNGTLMKTLYDLTYLDKGSYSINWDGTGDSGLKLKTGVYIYQLVTPRNTDSKRIVLK